MSSRTSTSPPPAVADTGFRPWHLYVLLSMIAATAAVIVSRQTHPVALLVLSASVMASGLVGLAIHRALTGFAGGTVDAPPVLGDRAREAMLRDKALVLRSIKELEFDRATGKVSAEDFRELNARLRAKAISLLDAIEHLESPPPMPPRRALPTPACPACATLNDADAKFCKQCGHKLG